MALRTVLQHVTVDNNIDIDKCKEMKGWLARLRNRYEWYLITCVRLQPEGVMVVLANNSDDHTYLAENVLCVPADKVGHWTINGKSSCRTNYECERSLVCACTYEKYLLMSKAVKEAHPDRSTKCVSHTCWYPTRCPERDDRDTEYNLDMNTRSYVNLALLVEALKLTTGGVTNSSGYEVKLYYGLTPDREEWPNVNGVTLNHVLFLHVSRYTMNPHGFHIGYEEYEGALEILEARGSEKRSMHKWSDWVVDIDSLDMRVVSAPETEECACESGNCDCPEGNHVCKDECQCEMYTGADEDFAWEEVEHVLHEALNVPLYWHFDRNETNPMMRWRIVNRRTDEIVWEPDVSSMPPAQAPLV